MKPVSSEHIWQIHDPAGRRKYVNDDELRRFLAGADRLPLPERALCHLLAYTGCRVSEALAVTIHQLDTTQHTVTFQTLKRRRPSSRTVPVPAVLMLQLLNLARTDEGRFWPMHRVTAWLVVKDVMQRTRILGPMACPKGLRHGFGMRAASRNVPISLIQRWMGHASSITTAIYLEAVGDEERRFARRMWPAAGNEGPLPFQHNEAAPRAPDDPATLVTVLRALLEELANATQLSEQILPTALHAAALAQAAGVLRCAPAAA